MGVFIMDHKLYKYSFDVTQKASDIDPEYWVLDSLFCAFRMTSEGRL